MLLLNNIICQIITVKIVGNMHGFIIEMQSVNM
jgi:hypothetical protein